MEDLRDEKIAKILAKFQALIRWYFMLKVNSVIEIRLQISSF